jgi:hypothetical protein
MQKPLELSDIEMFTFIEDTLYLDLSLVIGMYFSREIGKAVVLLDQTKCTKKRLLITEKQFISLVKKLKDYYGDEHLYSKQFKIYET